jgi:uncharacterized protein (TIGR03067 family)
MKRRIQLMAAIALAITATALAQEDPAKADLPKLKGTWVTVSLVANGKTLVDEKSPPRKASTKLAYDGNKWAVKVGEKTVATGIFKIDSTKDPKQIDVMDETGTVNEKTQLGIFKIDGDRYEYCVGQRGKPRPTAFESKEGTGDALVIGQREKK